MNFRDGGCVLPSPPDEELLREMMAWLVCEDVPAEYVPMMLEDMELDGTDQRSVASRSSIEARSALPVVVVGAGESGVLAGIRLTQAGIPFTIIEKNAGVGGTWFENSYPGCRVDVGNHFYCYSFEPSDHWTEYFAQQPEIRAYFEEVTDRHDLWSNIRFSTEVTRAEWDEADAVWRVSVRDVDGAESVLEARAVITAVGQLNRPQLPDIDGIDSPSTTKLIKLATERLEAAGMPVTQHWGKTNHMTRARVRARDCVRSVAACVTVECCCWFWC